MGFFKRAFIPAYTHLDDEEVQALEALMMEDDQSLKREFHLLRVLLAKAIEQFQNVSLDSTSDGHDDAIGALMRLAGIVDKLSAISERRAKVGAIAPREEQVVRVQFDDPKVQYLIKEKLREMHYHTIRQVLAVVIKFGDPSGALRLAEKLPSSFAPFLPTSGEAKQLEASKSEEGLGALDNTDTVL